MIIETNYSNKNKSLYKCDRCGSVSEPDNNFKIYKQGIKDSHPFKKWDLCKRCYSMLVKGIDKGPKKRA